MVPLICGIPKCPSLGEGIRPRRGFRGRTVGREVHPEFATVPAGDGHPGNKYRERVVAFVIAHSQSIAMFSTSIVGTRHISEYVAGGGDPRVHPEDCPGIWCGHPYCGRQLGEPLFAYAQHLEYASLIKNRNAGRESELVIYQPPWQCTDSEPNPRYRRFVAASAALETFDRLLAMRGPGPLRVALSRNIILDGPQSDQCIVGIEYEAVGGDMLRAVRGKPTDYPRVAAVSVRTYGGILRITTHVAEGLSALAAVGISHGELSSQAVRVLPNGDAILPHVRYQDFLPNLTDETIRYTLSDRYMAPERYLCDDTASPTPAGDVYSFGVLLLEMLTCRVPYIDTCPPGYITNMRRAVRAGMCQHVPEIYPAELAALIYRCAAPDPAQRPRLGAVLSELRRITDSASYLGDDVPEWIHPIGIVPWDGMVVGPTESVHA